MEKKEPNDILNYRMKTFILEFASDVFSRQEYEDFFKGGISEKTARNDLSGLVDLGLLTKTGRGTLTKYERTGKQLPDITG
ncbi:hypothetical protein D3C85_1563970 [compost metagenome]